MDVNGPDSSENILTRLYRRYSFHTQRILDKITPNYILRWLANILLIIFFMYRVVSLQGFYIVAYVLGIFLLNQFILFLTPVMVDELDEDDDEPSLPTKSDEEFRPFMRRLPEFKFWYTTYKSLVISVICTYFQVFDIPVFWPILVMYFITLFLVTMKRQIKHMIRHRYVPFSYGKVRYQGKSNTDQQSAKLSK
ncbi:unnamed protein product [Brachionus calyciflorus]|uniref:Protein RER1 n=1 Tax=Brachionus calyciflorus TaxID=104777 RepID=A0A813PUD4_9BILA|nr:unnamed protein product [Brachionus calyciflorus]